MRSRLKAVVSTAAALAIGLVAISCGDDPPVQPLEPPDVAGVVREYSNGCAENGVTSTIAGDSQVVVVTFDGSEDRCKPRLAQWGIDMGDPVGTDPYQGDTYWVADNKLDIYMNGLGATNIPTPSHVVENFYTPPIGAVEFDPPVRRVKFHYSRLLDQRAWWNGQQVDTDSMRVRAIGGTYTLASRVLHSNVASDVPPWDTWTESELSTSSDLIEWVVFDGHILLDNLVIIRDAPDTTFSVSVDCSPDPVQRGDDLECSASWSPTLASASEILFEWSFEGDSVEVYPDPTAKKFDPLQPVSDSAHGMASWQGPVVLPGRVTVSGRWGSQSDTAQDTVSVTARTAGLWGALPISLRPDTADLPVSLPNDTFLAGRNQDTLTKIGDERQVIRDNGQALLAVVPDGPNAGYWYLRDPGVYSTREIGLSRWLTGKEPQPYFDYSHAAQLLTHRGFLEARYRRASGRGPRMHRTDSAAFRNGVWAHEAYGQNGAPGHQGQLELAARSLPTCGRVPTILERIVSRDSARLMFDRQDVINEGKKSVYSASWHNFVYGNYSSAPWYPVLASVTHADTLTVSLVGDVQGSARPELAPDPLYKCTRIY